jgi:hypothetical protein
LNAALREQSSTGTPFTEVLVRDGIVGAEDLARVAGPKPQPAATEPQPPAVASAPTPAVVPSYVVRGRLTNGEAVEIASVAEPAEAQRIALDAMRACARAAGSDWPVLNGRYVRPESIVAIDVVEQ